MLADLSENASIEAAKWNGIWWLIMMNEMKWNEIRWNEMRLDEVKWNEMKWNEMKWLMMDDGFLSFRSFITLFTTPLTKGSK